MKWQLIFLVKNIFQTLLKKKNYNTRNLHIINHYLTYDFLTIFSAMSAATDAGYHNGYNNLMSLRLSRSPSSKERHGDYSATKAANAPN